MADPRAPFSTENKNPPQNDLKNELTYRPYQIWHEYLEAYNIA